METEAGRAAGSQVQVQEGLCCVVDLTSSPEQLPADELQG